MTTAVPFARPSFTAADLYLASWETMVSLKLRERRNNDGPGIEPIQAVTGNKPPDKYCASTVAAAGIWAFRQTGRRWPLKVTANCDELMEDAKAKGAFHIPERTWVALGKPKEHEHLVAPVRRGMVFVILRTLTDAVHTGAIVRRFDDDSFETGEGNAADPKRPSSVDGTGIYGGRHRNHADDVVKATGKPRLYGLIDWENLIR